MDATEIVATMATTWNDADADGWAAVFTPDAVFVDVLGRVQHGPEVIAREHRNIFGTIYRGSRLDARLLAERDLGGGLVLVHSTTTLDVPDGPRAGVTRSVQTMLLRDGRVAAFQNTIRSAMADFTDDDAALAVLDPMGWRA